jgi:NADH:quinone reductase (non-electrogenic)
VLGLGSVTAVPDIPGLRDHALLFHSPADALQLRNHIIDAIEKAHQCENMEDRKAWLTFVVGGGGDTGCELVATIWDYAVNGLLKQYPWLEDTPPRVVVVEQKQRLMPMANKKVSAQVTRILKARNIDIRTDTTITQVAPGSVHTSHGEIPAHTIFWAAGTTAVDVVRDVRAEHQKNGALPVDGCLRLPEHPEVYVLGDSAWICDPKSGAPVPPTAQAAEQEGRYVARAIVAQLRGLPPLPAFRFESRGHLTLLGSHTAVAELGPLVLTGPLAWLLWHGYYMTRIPAWHNRLHLAADRLLAALVGRETSQLRLGTSAPPPKH